MTDINKIKELVNIERKEANKEHGESFNSNHEAYAVLLEEVEEAKEDVDQIALRTETAWQMIKGDDVEQFKKEIEFIVKYAIHAIQELIQVAGVCDKALGKPIPFGCDMGKYVPCEKCDGTEKCPHIKKTIRTENDNKPMSAVEYAKTLAIICNHGCKVCPLNRSSNGKFLYCEDFCTFYPEEAVRIVQKWAESRGEQK